MRIKEIKPGLDFFLMKGVVAITLAPFGIFMRKWAMNDKAIVMEEKIHWKQQCEMFFIGFYLWYLIEYLFKWPLYRKDTYKNLSMEREAKKNCHIGHYLTYRKHFAWFKYFINL